MRVRLQYGAVSVPDLLVLPDKLAASKRATRGSSFLLITGVVIGILQNVGMYCKLMRRCSVDRRPLAHVYPPELIAQDLFVVDE